MGKTKTHRIALTDAALLQQEASPFRMISDALLDRFKSIISRATLDENQFGSRPHLRDAREDIRNICCLVARGNNDRHEHFFGIHFTRQPRARYNYMRQRRYVRRQYLNEVAIKKGGKKRNRQWEEYFLMMTNDLEIRKLEQGADIFNCEPILRQVRSG